MYPGYGTQARIEMHGLRIPDSQIFNDIATPAALSCVYPYIQRLEMDPERSFSLFRVYYLRRYRFHTWTCSSLARLLESKKIETVMLVVMVRFSRLYRDEVVVRMRRLCWKVVKGSGRTCGRSYSVDLK